MGRDTVIGLFQLDPKEDLIGTGAHSKKYGVVSVKNCERPVVDPVTGDIIPLCVKITERNHNRIITRLSSVDLYEKIPGVCRVVSTGKIRKLDGQLWWYTIMKHYRTIDKNYIRKATRETIVNIIQDVAQTMNHLKSIGYTHSDLFIRNIALENETNAAVIIDVDSLTRYTPFTHNSNFSGFVQQLMTLSGCENLSSLINRRSLFISPDSVDFFLSEEPLDKNFAHRYYDGLSASGKKHFSEVIMRKLLNHPLHADTQEVLTYKLALSKTPFDEIDLDVLRHKSPDGFYVPPGANKHTLPEY